MATVVDEFVNVHPANERGRTFLEADEIECEHKEKATEHGPGQDVLDGNGDRPRAGRKRCRHSHRRSLAPRGSCMRPRSGGVNVVPPGVTSPLSRFGVAHVALTTSTCRKGIGLAWTVADMPDQSGRLIVVTGASSGIGAAAAAALAARGAHVILAVRDAHRGAVVRQQILARHPQALADLALVDLAELASVRRFAADIIERGRAVDAVLNVAGLGLQPVRAVTRDGFECQFGTNHLGAFALTGLLLPVLRRAPGARVVAVASVAHRQGRIDFDDLQGTRRYSGMKAYAQSKLADLLFALELDRRARAAGAPLVSVAAHPGISRTAFFAKTNLAAPVGMLLEAFAAIAGQDADAGALPILYAATMPDVRGGQYWGPDGWMEWRGAPALASLSHRARDLAVAARLWSVSERLTDVRFDFGDQAPHAHPTSSSPG